MRARMWMAVVVFIGAVLMVGPAWAQQRGGGHGAIDTNGIEHDLIPGWVTIGYDSYHAHGSVGIGTEGPFLAGGDVMTIMSAKLPTYRAAVGVATNPLTGKIYCFGGGSGSYFINDILEYDPIADRLVTKSATLPTGRHGMAVAANPLTGKIYCLGGMDSSGALSQILEYDPAADSLVVKTASLPSRRYQFAAGADPLTGKIYCFAGYNPSAGVQLNQIVEYDPATNSVVVKSATLPSLRAAVAVATNPVTGKIYCIGGGAGSNFINAIIEYDPATNVLTTKAGTLPTGRWGMAAAADPLTGKIYSFGGHSSSGYLNEVVEYDPAADTVAVNSAVLPTGRYQFSAAAHPVTGKMFCFGGDDAITEYDQIVEYSLTSQVRLQVGNPGDGGMALSNNWGVFSSQAFKREITALAAGEYQGILDKVNATDVVRFVYAQDARKTRHLGVIAEDAPQEILSPGGQAVNLADYNAFLLAAIKAQQAGLDEKNCQLEELRARVEALESLVNRLTAPSAEARK